MRASCRASRSAGRGLSWPTSVLVLFMMLNIAQLSMPSHSQNCHAFHVEDLRVAFGRRVRAIRQERELSQETLAERAGLHWTYISGVERGQRAPSLDVLGRIANGLAVTPAELFAPLN